MIILSILVSVIALGVIILIIALWGPDLDGNKIVIDPNCVMNDPKNLKNVFVKTTHLKNLKVKNS